MKSIILIEKYRERKCTKCDKIYPAILECFHKLKFGKYGLRPTCKICREIESNKYYDENKIEINKNSKIYRKTNTDKEKKRHKKYYSNNKKKCIDTSVKYRNKKRNSNNLFRLSDNIRRSINRSFKKGNFKKNSRTHEIIRCSFEEFKIHIEKQFLYWMNWDNYGLYNGKLNFGWDLDHIIPVSSAITKEELLKLNHFSNFQPLCSHFNRNIKKDKVQIIIPELY